MKAAVIVVWYGPFPVWMKAFLIACSHVRSVDWIIVHEAQAPEWVPSNVKLHHLSWTTFREQFEQRTGVIPPVKPDYKLCDTKVCFGHVFADLIEGYDYFGWGDLDLIPGALDRFLEPLLGQYDAISFHGKMLSNHLVLFRNASAFRELYQEIPDYKEVMSSSKFSALDDLAFTAVVKELPKVYFEEFYTTPHVNWMPWCDGTYTFPTAWYWDEGHVTNNLDRGYEFPYFHFMVWKGGKRFYYTETANWAGLSPDAFALPDGCQAFSITTAGLAARKPGSSNALKRIAFDGCPTYSLARRVRIRFQRLLGKR